MFGGRPSDSTGTGFETLELFKTHVNPGCGCRVRSFLGHAIEEHPEVRLVDELANLKADQKDPNLP
ncbi:MAG: hypothetical protein Ct9H300mP8_04710 [Gammaproteobacteria bacterium]|nr:MAG: hypothetical protein Ct9H300mP8_04710 [Gammaproteobacteria bacterium]